MSSAIPDSEKPSLFRVKVIFNACLRLKSVLKRHVQLCLIDSLIARVHRKALSLSETSWHIQLITEQSYQLRIQLRFAQLIIYPRYDFTWITEVETGNAKDVRE